MYDSNTSDSNGGSQGVSEPAPGAGAAASAAAASPIKQALAAIRDLRARLDAVQARETEPIAIVGMACRYPGCADLASFWRLLLDGRDAVTEVPADRWSLDAFYDPDPSRPGKMTSRWAGVIDHLDEFDAAFFGISPREAPHVDPRQRLSLELMWEALEHAGIPPDSLAGTLTGVFMATLTNDYDHLLFDDLRRADAYSGAGTANSIVANRLSYFLDVRGPSLALDTACSGSLVAVHLACESLRRGESTLALAGGVNVNLMPKSNVFFSKAGALSPSGRCKTFDGRADGMVRSDGAGVIVLKRLSDARRDGDRVIAAIKGSAVNHDGRSNGLMAPNGDAQKAVLTEAYRRAGVAPGAVQYIEAHGTGTKLGDPIEVQALGDVLAADRPVDRKCLLGSLKTNVGHTEAAAGIGGLIKTALALGHRVIPPAVHFTDPNPLIPFDRLPFVVPRQASAWPSPDAPLVAGVSGFGFGGTNAHVVLQDAASALPPPTESATAPPYMLVCSARTAPALRQLAEGFRDRLVEALDGSADATSATATTSTVGSALLDGTMQAEAVRRGGANVAAGDICAAAALGRTHHRAHRLAVAGDSRETLLAALERRIAEMDGAEGGRGAAATPAAAGGSGRLVFVFSGQGSHWPRMGQRLAAREPVFKAALDECDRLFAPLLKTSIVEEIARAADTSRLNETALTQPAIFSMQIALVALWRSFGVAPDAVIGHSLGEVAAACAAGVITLEEGVRIVYHRSRLMTRAAGRGRTIVAGLSFDDARELVRPFEPALAVAGSNGPGTSVIAGDPESVAEVMRVLESRGTFCRAIQGVDIAFHSPHMDPLRDELVDALSGDPAIQASIAIFPRAAKIPIVSTVTGTWAKGETFDATYWGRNLRDPFLFARAIGVLLGDSGNGGNGTTGANGATGAGGVNGATGGNSGIRACLEISPDAVLASSIGQCARQAGQPSLPILSSMRRATDEPLHLFEQVARLYELGESLQWRGIHRSRRHASLPSYPWQRQRFWFDQLTPAEPRSAEATNATHATNAAHVSNGVHARSAAHASGASGTNGTNGTRAASVTHGALDTARAHPLLDEAIEPASSGSADRVCLWQFEADATRPAWVADHKVLGDVMVPGAAMLELAIAAARQVWAGGDSARADAAPIAEASALPNDGAGMTASIAVTGMTFDQPIRLDVPRLLQVMLTVRGTEADFTLHSRPAGSRDAWTKHATARVGATSADAAIPSTSDRPKAAPIDAASSAGSVVVTQNDERSAAPGQVAEAIADRVDRSAAATHDAAPSAGSVVVTQNDESSAAPGHVAERAARIGTGMSVDAHYAAMTADGLEYGPAFRGIRRLWANTETGGDAPLASDASPLCPSSRSSHGGAEGGRGGEGEGSSSSPIWGEAFAEIQLPSEAGAHDARYAMHPAMLDAAFQTVADAVGRDDRQRYLPRGVANWRVIDAVGDRVWCHVRVTARGPEGLTADIDLLNDDGRLVARVDGLSLVRFGAPRRNPLEDALLEERWEPRELTAPIMATATATTADGNRAARARAWLILADGTGVGEALTARLRANGEQVTVARWGAAWRQDDAHIELRAGDRGDMDRLLTAAMSASGRIDHVVHLWSLDTRSPEAYSDCETATVALETAETRAVGSALHLAQALVQAGSTARLWLTTRGTQAVTPQAVSTQAVNAQAGSTRIGSTQDPQLHPVNSPDVNGQTVNGQTLNAPVLNASTRNAPTLDTPALNTPTATPAVNLLASNPFWAAKNASIEIQQAAVNGLALTIGQEHPELRCTTIDLDGASRAPAQVTSLTAELLADDRETRVAWRRGTRYVTRLVAAPWPREAEAGAGADSPVLRDDATYLITGGLGALGLRTAAALARLGARHLVLTGRRGIESMGDAAAASIRAIERAGATVKIARADISISADADHLFASVLSNLPPLRGVIHAAGVLDDALVPQQSIDRFRTVMAPKLRGTWNLHVHTRALPLDFFVCYSSAASLVGSPGQANYAAGNACMDAIAHHRHALGLPASSINWGAWGEEGMAANAQMHARLAARGVAPIATSDGLALLSRLLRDTTPRASADADADVDVDADAGTQAITSDRATRQDGAGRPAVFGVMPVAWGTFLKQFPAGVPSRFEMLAPAASAADTGNADGRNPSSSASDASNAASSAAAVLALRALTRADRRRHLQQMLRDTLAAVLGFGAALELGPREKYFDLGMDSLLSVEFRNRLQQTFSIALPATLAFEYPTIETLAEHIDGLLAERFQSDELESHPAVIPAAAVTSAREGDDADALDVLPTDEIARLLAAELSEEAVRVR